MLCTTSTTFNTSTTIAIAPNSIAPIAPRCSSSCLSYDYPYSCSYEYYSNYSDSFDYFITIRIATFTCTSSCTSIAVLALHAPNPRLVLHPIHSICLSSHLIFTLLVTLPPRCTRHCTCHNAQDAEDLAVTPNFYPEHPGPI